MGCEPVWWGGLAGHLEKGLSGTVQSRPWGAGKPGQAGKFKISRARPLPSRRGPPAAGVRGGWGGGDSKGFSTRCSLPRPA